MEAEPINVRQLLHKHNIKLSKGLGQYFLISDSALHKVVLAAEIEPDDIVLEIGPGIGNLTRLLAVKSAKVVAVEIDSSLFPALEEVTGEFSNIKLIQDDILNVDIGSLFQDGEFLVVANIPYYITSILLRLLLEGAVQPRRLVLTVQKEVAKRLTAKPGNLSILALSVQVFGQIKIMNTVPASAFVPVPKVDSAIVRVDIYPEPLIAKVNLDTFFRLIKAGFSQKRKTLKNSLSAGMNWTKDIGEQYLDSAGIDPTRRAQTLDIQEWEKLVKVIKT